MAKEIERKFIVDPKFIKSLDNGTNIKQGYLPSSNNTVVRIRITDKKAFLTIKGENKGAVRSEFEYSIPFSDANQILKELCEKPYIEKTRYIVNYSGVNWEVDVFEGDNEGLTIGEIEIETEDEYVDIPNWAVKEVTDDPKYFNSNLIKNPYKKWKNT
jgi:adenylate cyclase